MILPLEGFTQSQILRSVPSNDELVARLSELSSDKTPLPDDLNILYDLNSRYEDELATYRRALASIKPKDNSNAIDKAKAEAASAITELRTIDCKIAAKDILTRLRKSLNDSYRAISDTIFMHDLEPDDPWRREDGGVASNGNTCEALKSFIGDDTKQEAIINFFDTVKEKYEEDARAREALRGNLQKVIELLQTRKADVQQLLNEKTSQQQLSGSLWIVISVIGLFSIGAILCVKLFSENIQMEWVTSGQVIQFVTVMILLSVIMALGLAGILKETTLGTLLGGIGGYVLAQGVGRAAAREVSRERSGGS
ncbi:MAG: hypothetical protein HOP03_04645 [Lysobacter sp.]|nr:hypothetical protein [Lysobacter sp.]